MYAFESEINQIQDFKCGICGENFVNKKDFMKHRKKEQIEKIQDCFNR